MRSIFVVALLTATACQKPPKAGAVCGAKDEGTFVCQDAATALFCKAGIRNAVPCRGPKGCSASSCDETLARVGDACTDPEMTSFPRIACSEDKKTELVCRKGKFELALHCRGSRGCDPTQLFPALPQTCDRSVVLVGDECNVTRPDIDDLLRYDNSEQCVADGTTTARCNKDKDGTFELARNCSGPKACRSIPSVGGYSEADCDVSVAALGSPCGKRQGDTYTCNADGSSLLLCSRNHVWERARACEKGEHCAFESGPRGADCVR